MKKLKSFQNILSVVFLLLICHQLKGQQLSVNDFAQHIDTAKNAVVLDVRTPQEFSEGHIKEALNIDFRNSDFNRRTDLISKSNTIYIYCLSGGRSAKAATELRSRGYEVFELNGGMLKWRAGRMPEEKSLINRAAGMTLDDYARMIKSNPKVLIDFYAEWCAPCKLMEPYLTELQKSEKDGIKVFRIDVDKNPQLATDLKIDALPVVHYYRDGEIKWGYVGYMSKKTLMKRIRD